MIQTWTLNDLKDHKNVKSLIACTIVAKVQAWICQRAAELPPKKQIAFYAIILQLSGARLHAPHMAPVGSSTLEEQ